MSVVSILSVRPNPETELELLGQLVVTLSGRLARVHLDGVARAVAETLDQVVAATCCDGCHLIEFTESGLVSHVYASSTQAPVRPEPVMLQWFSERLARGEQVTIAGPEALAGEGSASGQQGRRTETCAMLGVPAAVSGEVVCALVLNSSRFPRRWPAPLVEALQLLAEIMGAGLQRERDERELRANVAVIEQLNARLQADNVYLKEELKTYHDFDDIVGESPALRLALSRLEQVAPTNSSVLLLGPTGTGKELFARAVHERSRRHARPLVRVNCAALPPTLVESELFGHEKGAFTGAVAMRQGRFELADGGTIFLDEIGDLTPDIQVKFLRVLQEGEFERVGSSRTKKVDVRVIAATHHDLEKAVAEGRFRADLYYRLSVYPIRLPSLEERFEDIPRLMWFFIHRHQRELERRITKVPQAVVDALQRRLWPGNVRELENVIERAMIASTGEVLQLDEPTATDAWPGATPDAESGTLDSVQRTHIEAVLERCGWRINGPGNAAERLGLHPNTLRFRMKKLGIARAKNHGQLDPASVA
jgi:transcriptional regulator with GAF, ATPase, and Fis domain